MLGLSPSMRRGRRANPKAQRVARQLGLGDQVTEAEFTA
jgi:hypothetical protein